MEVATTTRSDVFCPKCDVECPTNIWNKRPEKKSIWNPLTSEGFTLLTTIITFVGFTFCFVVWFWDVIRNPMPSSFEMLVFVGILCIMNQIVEVRNVAKKSLKKNDKEMN